MTTNFGIRALSEKVGVSPHTLRYYELAGLMIPVTRDGSDGRLYSEEHVRWVCFLLRLREGGMGISEIRRYARLTRSESPDDRVERLAMLREHRDRVRSMIRTLTEHLEVLERKVAAGCAPDAPAERRRNA